MRFSTPQTNSSIYNSKSRYVQGGTTDRSDTKTGWWERRLIENDESDITITVTPEEHQRPDIIAYNLYKRPELMWLVLQYNNIVDVHTELVMGATLTMPTERRMSLAILNRSSGGNRV